MQWRMKLAFHFHLIQCRTRLLRNFSKYFLMFLIFIHCVCVFVILMVFIKKKSLSHFMADVFKGFNVSIVVPPSVYQVNDGKDDLFPKA